MLDLTVTPALPPAAQVLGTSLKLSVLPLRTLVRVQIARRDIEAAMQSLGPTRLPTRPGTVFGVDPVAWWLAPNAWLVTSERLALVALAAHLDPLLGALSHTVVDVSDSLVTFELEGAGAAPLLARGTGIDIATALPPGHCARTRLATLPVLLRSVTPRRMELLVDRAPARWLHEWLIDAAMMVDG